MARNTPNPPYRFPVPLPTGWTPGCVLKGDTWDDLATAIDDRLAGISGKRTISVRISPGMKLADNFTSELQKTITTFNGYAEAGEDPEFLRGTTPIQRPGARAAPRTRRCIRSPARVRTMP